MPNATVRANAQAMPEDRAHLVALAREMIAAVRANGHDIHLKPTLSFCLSVSAPAREPPHIQNKGMISFALGVDLTPYALIFESPDCDAILAAAIREA